MIYENHSVKELKIAYIGGGSRGWAWTLMNDLAKATDMSGTVYLYDIDFEAAKNNETIGKKFPGTGWEYKAVRTAEEAMTGADFVIISILPATFDEMEFDVHAPEKYGIYQSVGDTAGPGGFFRALRTVPMMREIAANVRKHCPRAWVINYTNPMTVCVKALYSAFPKIKAFGCCHEVFGTQQLLRRMIEEQLGLTDIERRDIRVNVIGVNHFTWLTEGHYFGHDIFPMYKEFAAKHFVDGIATTFGEDHINNSFACRNRVKFDLFQRYGYLAAAGDRHLAEFCPGDWYLESPEQVRDWMFGLTTVAWRKNDLKERLARSARLVSGEEEFVIKNTGEEGVMQMRAILGLGDIVTNVNMPNYGQIPNLPLGAVVETNAAFTSGMVTPVAAGEIPAPLYPLISRISGNQEMLVKGCVERDLDLIFTAFVNDPLVRLPLDKSRELFARMVKNTAKYLPDYDLSTL